MVLAVPREALDGKTVKYTLLDWASRRLPRVAKSTLSAETQSYDNASDSTEWVRTLLSSLTDASFNMKSFASELHKWPATVVTDCKSLYDVLSKDNSTGQATTEKRGAIEMILLKDKVAEGSLEVRWCPTAHMKVDPLTKDMRRDILSTFLNGDRLTFASGEPPAEEKTE